MSTIKKLAGQTAIYGLSTIVARLINYLLTPYLTRVFDTAQYGINAEFYAYDSFLNILFTYGLETAYFRFANSESNKDRVFDTAFITLLISTCIFSGLIIVFAQPIANWLQYPNQAHYIIWFAMILAFDTLCILPFAKLRVENRPIRYAAVKTFGILVNVVFVLFFTGLCPYLLNKSDSISLKPLLEKIYNPGIGIGYTFIANVVGSAAVFAFFIPGLIKRKYIPTSDLLKRMLPYALPMLIVGTAGMVNETLDRYLLKILLPMPLHDRQAQIGIYSACYKLSIIMTLFIQAYKMAAEPFFFAHSNKENPQQVYAQSMEYFVIVCSAIFLGVMVYIDIIKYFIGKPFHEGLHIVPILLMANMCLGAYYNLSIWYKLTDRTRMGSMIAIIGALITLVLNYIWIPIFGYTGAAWATFSCYVVMMLLSYITGQRYYPVPYPIGRMLIYVIAALVLWQFSVWLKAFLHPEMIISIGLGTILLLIFAGTVYSMERRKK